MQRSKGVPIQIRVGLNAGEVVVRAIGSDLHMDYIAVGQTTHLAARMEQMAMPGSILITIDVLRLTEGYVQVTWLGLVAVQGLRAPIEGYELVGTGPVPSRLQAAAVGGLSRFVGRDGELDDLDQTLQSAGSGHGQVVALGGEPGEGKPPLVYECLRSHRTQGWLVLQCASISYEKATPYIPVVDLLERYMHVEDGDEPRPVRANVTGHLLTLDEPRVAGLTGDCTALVTTRPCRAPHHTISDAGLIGVGHVPMPSDVSDELLEFGRHVLEVLRQPLEKGVTNMPSPVHLEPVGHSHIYINRSDRWHDMATAHRDVGAGDIAG